MDRMGAMPQSGMQSSAVAGVPGGTHLYHVGATDFFLDQSEQITITTEQQVQLCRQKEAALLEEATLGRKIEQSEQELWTLTGSDVPDVTRIEAQARVVGEMRADQRIAFIRAVCKATLVLTDEQRKQLAGFAPPNAAHQPALPATGMGGSAALTAAMTPMKNR